MTLLVHTLVHIIVVAEYCTPILVQIRGAKAQEGVIEVAKKEQYQDHSVMTIQKAPAWLLGILALHHRSSRSHRPAGSDARNRGMTTCDWGAR
jgi:hypothetical protein